MGYYSSAKRYYASGKRKYARAKRWSNTPQTPKALAVQAIRGVKHLKGLVNVEKHRHIISIPLTNIDSDGTVISLTDLAQGNDAGQRTGNSVLVKGIATKMVCRNSASSFNTTLRLMWFMDTQQVGDTSPSVTDVLDGASVVQPLNHNTVGRFKILKQIFITMSNTGGNTQKVLNFFIKLNHHVRYNGTTVSDIQRGGLYLLAISDEDTNMPSINATQTVQYYDN